MFGKKEVKKEKKEKKEIEKIGKFERFLADLEKIKANIDALNEVREVNNERFSRTAEQIGELRSMIIEIERRIGEIESEAEKAIDAVKSTQPEKLLEEVNKSNLKIEALKSKIDSLNEITAKIIAEIKELREKFSLFYGLEEIMELSKEMRDNIGKYKKIQGKIERDADKTESLFIEVNKKFEEFRRYKEMLSSFEERLKNIEKLADSLNIKVQTLLDANIFNEFKRKIENQLKEIDKIISLLDSRISERVKEEIKSFEKSLNKQYNKLVEKIKDTEKLKEELNENYKRILNFEKNFNVFIKEGEKTVQSLERNKSFILNQIKELKIKDKFQEFEKKLNDIMNQINEKIKSIENKQELRDKEKIFDLQKSINELKDYSEKKYIEMMSLFSSNSEKIDILDKRINEAIANQKKEIENIKAWLNYFSQILNSLVEKINEIAKIQEK